MTSSISDAQRRMLETYYDDLERNQWKLASMDALWAMGMNTYEIARELRTHESLVYEYFNKTRGLGIRTDAA